MSIFSTRRLSYGLLTVKSCQSLASALRSSFSTLKASFSTPSSPGLFQCRSSSLKWDGLDCRAEVIAKMPSGVTLQSLSLWTMQWHVIIRTKQILHLGLIPSNELRWGEEGCLPQYLKFTVQMPQVIGQDLNSCFSQTVFTQVQYPKVWEIWEQSWFQNRAAACGDSAVWEPEETVTHHIMNLSRASGTKYEFTQYEIIGLMTLQSYSDGPRHCTDFGNGNSSRIDSFY